MLPVTDCAVLVIINPAGPVHSVATFTSTFKSGFNFTVQVRLIVDPMDVERMGLEIPLDSITELGADETARKRHIY